MTKTRAIIRALSVLSLFAGLAGAQVFTGGGSSGPFGCVANVSNPSQARSEGYAELLGDITVVCTGGVGLTPGAAVAAINITISLNTTVTSRVFSNGLSEALLTIDEPGAGIAAGPGAALPQTVCSGGALGAGPGGCATYAEYAGSRSSASTCSALTGSVCTTFGTTPNVFQGVVNANQVIFTGIPILPPVTAGYARVFRITNVRANAAELGLGGPTPVLAPVLASITMGGGIPVQNPVQTTAIIFDGLNATSVRTADNSGAGTSISVLQCAANGLTPGAVLRFTEGFANAFKTRISPTGTLSGAATPASSTITAASFAQNVPGMIYPGSESGLILPASGGTAGLADFGARLKATFYNVPAGVNIYVSTTNINPQGNMGVNPLGNPNSSAAASAVAAGNFSAVGGSIGLLAGLVSSETATSGSGVPLPLTAATNTSAGVSLFGPLAVDVNGTATAVWEILLTNPYLQESAEFVVFYTLNGNAAANTPPLTPVSTAALSFAGFRPASTSSTIVSVASCQTASSLALTSSVNPSVTRQAVTLKAIVSAGAGAPTGTVTFKDGATTLGTAALAGGQATFTTAALALGTHAITAAYNGDGDFAGATSATLSQVVNKAVTTTSLNLGFGWTTAGQPAAFSATVTSPAGTATGTVTFRNGALVLGTAALDAGGVARISGIDLPIGRYTITASYNGDANFLSSSSGARDFSVNARPATVSTPSLQSGTPVVGQALTFTATVSADGSRVSGSMSFRDGYTSLGDAALDASGNSAITISSLSAGLHLITAAYSGDATNGAAVSAPLFLTIRGNSTVSLSSSLNPSDAGAAVTFTATVAASPTGSAAPSGSVMFTDGSTALGTVTLISGQAMLTLPPGLAAGDHSISAAYGGDTNFVSSSSSLTQRVNKAATTTTLSESVSGNEFILTAGVTGPAGAAPTGSARFMDLTTGAALGSASLSNNAATLALAPPLPVGHSLQAVYDGDAMFAGSSSAAQLFIAATNGFSFNFSFVPDGVSSIFGSALSGATASAPGLPLPTTLGGVTVRLIDADGRSYAASLYYVSPTQINFVLPGDVPAGSAKLLITTPGGVLTLAITTTGSGPALTSADGSGSGPAAAQLIRVHGDGTRDAAITPGDRVFLVLYGTGLRHAAGPVSCSLNGQSAPLLFAGAHSVYPGLDQVNLEIPGALRGVISVSCSADGRVSNVVTVSVE